MRRPHWRDPRLGVGILLVVASVALGSVLMARADRSIEVYQAEVALTPGDPLSADVLTVVRAQLDDVDGSYLLPSADLDGAVATRTVPAGDLVPMSAVGSADEVAVRPVQVSMSAAMQDVVQKGTAVDLWVALPDPSASGALLPPQPLVGRVEVSNIHEDTSVFAGVDELQIQVLIPESELADVLSALSAGGQVTVVPVPGGSTQ
ncbi:MAG: hypothetical protein ACK5H2_03230 [Beutenbergiaceae bacterium]